MPTKYGDDVRAQARRLWLADRSAPGIAEELGIAQPDTVRLWGREGGWDQMRDEIERRVSLPLLRLESRCRLDGTSNSRRRSIVSRTGILLSALLLSSCATETSQLDPALVYDGPTRSLPADIVEIFKKVTKTKWRVISRKRDFARQGVLPVCSDR